ncbi:hypothetical protein CO151_01265 [bacterium CG_4_9_14_3_um_filter_65_15]|nr:MAG: hypothetical protein CO151_01265 [bacterium CG_4_9_14_3_um_filter_65_15]
MKNVTFGAFAVLLMVLVVGAFGCSSSDPTDSSPSSRAKIFNPPTREFAIALGNSAGPVTQEQAVAITENATGGIMESVEQEDQDGAQVFGVHVDAAGTLLDVKVRISDGAVTQIDDDGSGTGEGDGEHED